MDIGFAREVGGAFIKAYYGSVCLPSGLAHMYSKESSFMRTIKDQVEQDFSAHGKQEIQKYLQTLPKSKYQLTYVECTPSTQGSILIVVEGTFCEEFQPHDKAFHQTFLLAPNNGSSPQTCYYIHNDSMRIAELVPEPHVPQPPHVSPPSVPAQPPAPPAPPAPEHAMHAVPHMDAPALPPAEEIVESVMEEVMNNVPGPEPEPEVEAEEAQVADPDTSVQNEAVQEPEGTPEAAEEDEEEEEEDKKEEEEEEDDDDDDKAAPAAPTSYAAALAVSRGKAASQAVKTQVLSGGAVPNAPTKKKEETARKRAQPDKEIASLLRSNGKGEGGKKGGKGSKGSKGAAGDRGKKEGATAPPVSYSLYVTRFPESFSEEDCDKAFGKFGKITGKTIREKFAYVDFDSKAAVQKALGETIVVAGATLHVEEKKKATGAPRKEEAGSRPRTGGKKN